MRSRADHRRQRPGRRLPVRATPRGRRRGARAGAARLTHRSTACTPTSATSRTSRAPAPCCSTSRPTRSTTWPRSARWRARGTSPTSRRGSTAWPRSGCSSRRTARRSAPAGRSASCRPPAPRSSACPTARPQDEDTPVRPVNPYGAAKAFAHLMVDVYRHRGLHATSLVLYNHESPRRPAQFVTRKITSRRGRHRRPAPPRRSPSATWPPRATGAGRPTTSTRWCWPPAPPSPATTSSPPARATRSRSSSPRRSAASASTTGRRTSRSTPALFRPVDPTALAGDPTRIRTDLGWTPTVGFEEVVRRMVEADLQRLASLPTPASG